MPDKLDEVQRDENAANLSFSLEEVIEEEEVPPVTYNDLVRDVDLLEMTSDLQLDCHMAQEINYSTKFYSQRLRSYSGLLFYKQKKKVER